MRKIYSLVIVAVLLMATNFAFGQYTQVSPYPFSTKADFGVQCSGGQIHDDGVAENGYGWNATAGNPSAFCTKFIPTGYPYKFTKYCIALTRLSTGVANWTFKLTMWKSVNGMPGPVMDSTTVTASALPVWPTVTFYDFDLPATWAQVTGTDSVFIGLYTDPTTQTGVFVASDESTTTPLWPAWATTAAGPWQSPTVLWAGYRAFLQRAEGNIAGPSVIHTPLPNTQNVAGPYVVNATITPAGSSTISSAKIYWSRNNPTVTDSVTMTNSGSNYTGNIPGNGSNAIYRYYIKAIESDGLVGVHPLGAPTNLNSFTASSTDTTKPVIVHTPIGSTPKATWPVNVTASVTDNFGIDSVWVRWYKNTTSNYKQFKLLPTTGTNYAALFNSLNADVTPGDVIYYRIIAQDASAQHNRDSSALNNFPIIALVTACIGTGTTSSNYPFTTFWMDGRTQMLFTAAELNAQGLTANYWITKVGFNVLTADAATMNGFNVKFQLTSATSLTGFVTTGTWFTGYTGTWAVPGTGQQNINMQSPYFVYDGTSNLIVEVCYDNSAYTAYSTVASTAATGMTWGYYTDNSTGCTMTGGAVQAIRPNICFTATPVTGITPVGNIIPKEYSLSQNYPNPFNPVTKINFALPKQGMVTLKIYDVLGREVRTLVNEVKSAGNFSVDFNASEFSSGVYFYRLESNGFSDIKRMMLIK